MDSVARCLQNTGKFRCKVLTDSQNQPYMQGTPLQAGNYNLDLNDGSYVIQGGTSGTKIYLKFNIKGTATLIPTTFKLNTNGLDLNHFTSNTFTGALFIQPGVVLGEDKVTGNRVLTGEKINVRIKNLDHNEDPVDNSFQLVTGSGTPDKNFNFNVGDVPKIRDGRPGKYTLTASYDGHGVYTNGNANSLDGSDPEIYKVNNLPHSDLITGTSQTINAKLDYKVTNYWNNSVKNIEVEFRSDKGTTRRICNEDGTVSFNYGQDFGVDRTLDYTKSFTITPVNVGINNVRGSTDSISFHRQAGIDKSVCLQTMGKGLVTDKKTFNAPNGMSITAKGGIFGCIGLYKIQWFDKNKNLIKTEEWDNFKSWDKDERFFVPENAEYVKYQVGCKATGKSKPETDYLPAGNAIIFYEGAAGTENVHIAAANANGYEILREDYKC